ncbi:MAG: SDR family oxidoreductase, partial [Halobacteriovoraceae bacterium]|nr:SDR family oxidoreductase [Halobacteriovoraceae bacterium]
MKNKVIIVTGANGGIGQEICMSFLREGSVVVALYRGKIE